MSRISVDTHFIISYRTTVHELLARLDDDNEIRRACSQLFSATIQTQLFAWRCILRQRVFEETTSILPILADSNARRLFALNPIRIKFCNHIHLSLRYMVICTILYKIITEYWNFHFLIHKVSFQTHQMMQILKNWPKPFPLIFRTQTNKNILPSRISPPSLSRNIMQSVKEIWVAKRNDKKRQKKRAIYDVMW